MRFVIQREALLTPLQHMIGIVEKRQNMPILNNILLNIQSDSIKLTASNLEIELTEYVRLEHIAEEGNMAVPAHKLLDITRVLPANSIIEFELEDQKLLIKHERSRFTLLTLPAKDFPNIQYNKNTIEFTTTHKDLRYLFEHVYFSMAQQDVRFYLNGMLLELSKSNMRTVATDGHRLAMCTRTSQLEFQACQCLIPRKAILELLKLLTDQETPLTVGISENHLRISSNNMSFGSKLLDAKFPNYENVLPAMSERQITVDVEEFKRILSRISILSNEKYHGVRFLLQPSLLVITAKNNLQEEAREEIEVNYSGQTIEIGFNVNYFLDILSILSSGQVQITFSDNNSAVLQLIDKSDCLYVIMPMRL